MRLAPRFALLATLAACAPEPGPAPVPSPSARPSAEAPAARPSARPQAPDGHACSAAADCVLSCEWGAVRADWYAGRKETCEDGCSSKGMTTRCEGGRCVAYGRDGARADDCTGRALPP